ncbi:MAG: hypothetical protein D6714_18515 [Bacteroidetes bacterium]|nr:MAG: hypothetical protein D6714_18515 [Bacteroidota bacterium]
MAIVLFKYGSTNVFSWGSFFCFWQAGFEPKPKKKLPYLRPSVKKPLCIIFGTFFNHFRRR